MLFVNKLHLGYLFREYDFALQNSARAEQYLDGGTGTLLISIFYFYDSLVRLAIYPNASSDEQKITLEKVATNQEKIEQFAPHAPMNYSHKYHLVEAEKYRVTGAAYQAMIHYDRAIELAQEQRFINDEALGNELAANFYLEQKKEKFA